MKPLSATVVLSLFTPSFRRSTASSGSFTDHSSFFAREGGVEDFGDHIVSVGAEGGSVISNKV